MSLLSSWSRLQQASSTFLSSNSASEHELPLWRQPPPRMASPSSQPPISATSPPPPPFVPPAPITASIHASTARLRQNRALPDSMVLLRRQEKQLHDNLQDLLYQQDEALRVAAAAAAGGPGSATTHDDDMPADLSGSATPTARSIMADSKRQRSAEDHLRHQPQPHQHRHHSANNNHNRNNPPSIRAIRKAIRTAIRQLAAVKAEEGRLLGHDRASNDAVVRRLAGWAEQRTGLEAQIRSIEEGDSGAHEAAALRGEARALETEIRELEDRLHAARARHRALLADVAEIENSVQSKLSSYKASLSILDADIDGFLRTSAARDRRAAREAPFFQIPPKRRTLAMAREHWDEEQAGIEKMRSESEMEREALEQGAVVWNDVVHRIGDFERHIAEATRHQDADPTGEAKELVAHLTETINYVEAQLDVVEEKGWKLLVACIGAELSALHEGRRMLEAMLHAAGEISPTVEREKRLGDVEIEFQPSSLANSQTLQQNGDSGVATASKLPAPRQPRPDYHSTDEDEPDPELLISHQDTDDEHLG